MSEEYTAEDHALFEQFVVNEKLERIVELLHEVNGLQQEIATDTSSDGFCYRTHNLLEDLADTFENMIE